MITFTPIPVDPYNAFSDANTNPLTGNVTSVSAVALNVKLAFNVPAVVKLPRSVIVLVPLSTPVPPLPPGRIPLTSSVNLTEPQVGAPPALPCNTCVLVPSPLTVDGPVPEPPPSTTAFAVNAAADTSKPPAVLVLLPIAVITPVPVVAVDGLPPSPPPTTT